MNRRAVVLLCSLICFLFACKTDDTDEKFAEEEQKLAEYMTENYPEILLNQGIYLEKLSSNEQGIQPDPGDYVLVEYECRYLDGTLEQVSYKNWESYHALMPSQYIEGGPELWQLNAPNFFGIHVGIGEMHEGEIANIYAPSRYTSYMDFVTRIYKITLKKVIGPDLKIYQEALMGDYMKHKFGSDVDTITITDNGKDYYMMYHVVDPGTGGSIGSSSVKTHITEHYLLQKRDPRTIFENQEYTWNIDANTSKIFGSVKKGGQIYLMMPFKLRYTERRVNNNWQDIEPVGSVLLYEICIDN